MLFHFKEASSLMCVNTLKLANQAHLLPLSFHFIVTESKWLFIMLRYWRLYALTVIFVSG